MQYEKKSFEMKDSTFSKATVRKQIYSLLYIYLQLSKWFSINNITIIEDSKNGFFFCHEAYSFKSNSFKQ